MWSMGNELWFTSDLDSADGCCFLGQMIAVAHVEDSTGPAGVGGVQVNTAQLSAPCDVVGFNGGNDYWKCRHSLYGIGIRRR